MSRRTWDRTSASQHSAFQRCQRYWYFGWIERVPRITSPAQQRGKDIHTEGEHYLLTGELRDSEYTELRLNYRPYVEAVVPHLPPPQHPDLIIEHELWLPAIEGVSWLGYIDIGFSGVDPLVIRDIKSTSNFRYAKTPKELSEDIQVLSYARWAYEVASYAGEIDLGHIYVKTEKRVVRKRPKTKLVSCIVSQDHVNEIWEREMVTVEKMLAASNAKSAHDLPPTTTACGMYGGCPFRERCGITSEMTVAGMFQLDKKGNAEMGNKFLDKLKKGKKTKKPEGIVPPDAPERETSEEESEAIRAEATAKAEKAAKAKKAKAAKAKKTKTKKNGTTKAFVLYIDCMPKKDVGAEIEPTLFEDWFNPLVMKMNEAVMDEKKLPSYLLLPYAEEKAMVQLAVQESIEDLPLAMVVTSGSPGARDALGALVPHATQVVVGTRG